MREPAKLIPGGAHNARVNILRDLARVSKGVKGMQIAYDRFELATRHYILIASDGEIGLRKGQVELFALGYASAMKALVGLDASAELNELIERLAPPAK